MFKRELLCFTPGFQVFQLRMALVQIAVISYLCCTLPNSEIHQSLLVGKVTLTLYALKSVSQAIDYVTISTCKTG